MASSQYSITSPRTTAPVAKDNSAATCDSLVSKPDTDVCNLAMSIGSSHKRRAEMQEWIFFTVIMLGVGLRALVEVAETRKKRRKGMSAV